MFIGCLSSRVQTSAHCRTFPHFAEIGMSLRWVPFWAKCTSKTALIFVNKSTEKLGVL
jgi:hypothetical protein